MDDADTCRICRAEATEAEPLFHPCKCSGSIKHVHQACLQEWLRHAGKKPVCELCKTPYQFTKLYRSDMPAHMPIVVFVRQLGNDIVRTLTFAARLLLVVTLWLICLPFLVSHVFVAYSKMAEIVPYNLASLASAKPLLSVILDPVDPSRRLPLPAFVDAQIWHPLRPSVIKIVQGLTIMALLAAILFVIVVVREWVMFDPDFVQKLDEVDINLHRIDWNGEMEVLNRQVVDPDEDGWEDQEDQEEVEEDQDQDQDQQQQQQQQPDPLDQQAFEREMEQALAQEDNFDDFEDFEGFMDVIGLRGSLTTLMTTFVALSLGTCALAILLYFAPYLLGRIFLTALVKILSSRVAASAALVADRLIQDLGLEFIGMLVPKSAPTDYLLGNTLISRLIGTLVGYTAVLCTLSYYLAHHRPRGASLTTSPESVEMQAMLLKYSMQGEAVAKVTAVIAIELLVFPIYCGYLLGFSLVPLFDEFTVADWAAMVSAYPVAMTTLHWVLGILYMIVFALFVTMCRRIIRPGVLYFVRDPNDPEFHPIGDILQRPFGSQISKIASSGLFYCVLICGCVGGVLYGLRHWPGLGLLPIRLMPHFQPRLATPDDEVQISTLTWGVAGSDGQVMTLLRAIDMISPWLLVTMFNTSGPLFKAYWKWVLASASRMLRLSSFILNVAEPTERGHIYYRNIWARLTRAQPDYTSPALSDDDAKALADQSGGPQAIFVLDGTYVRAPNSDTVPLEGRIHLFVAVSKDDELVVPVDDQSRLPERAHYTVVYRPPMFRWRIVALLLLIWLNGMAMVFWVSGVPLVVGRLLSAKFLMSAKEYELASDLRYLSSGIAVVASVQSLVCYWDQLRAAVRDLLVDNDPNTNSPYSPVMIKLAKLFFMMTCNMAVICASWFLYSVYVSFPVYRLIDPAYLPDIPRPNLSPGVATSIMVCARLVAKNAADQWVALVMVNPMRYDGARARVLAAEMARGFVKFLAVPLVVYGARPWMPEHFRDSVAIFVPPASLALYGGYLVLKFMVEHVRNWATTVRDEAYLLGEQLQNM